MNDAIEKAYDLISGDEDARVCADIPESACAVVPGNFFRQLSAQILTKVGDALSDPKLVLTWLLESIGAPSFATAALVPVREAGSLLPQLAIGGAIRQRAIRKGFWVAGSLVQGFSILAIVAIAALLPPTLAGGLVVLALAAFAAGRAVCSVASKDLLGKTVPKTRRGRLGGLASTASGAVALATGVAFALVDGELGKRVLLALLVAAATTWFVAATIMARLEEQPGSTDGGGNALRQGLGSLGVLARDRAFRRFCIVRALLASTVLSFPFYVVLARRATDGGLDGFGVLLVASSAAAMASGAVWGRLADASSRRTLAVAGTAAGGIGLAAYALAALDLEPGRALVVYGGLFFSIGLAHTGIRLGRKTYLVDLATSETRATYVAVSNTVIGVVLLASGALGGLVPWIGERGVVLLYASLGLVGGLAAFRLEEA